MVMRSITKVPPNSRPKVWRAAVHVLVLVALTGSLATRVFHATIEDGQSVQSSAALAMRQHMDRDAAGWVRPAPVMSVLHVPVFYFHVVPADQPFPNLLLENSLHKRPPPAC